MSHLLHWVTCSSIIMNTHCSFNPTHAILLAKILTKAINVD